MGKKLRFIVGASGSGKSQRLFQELIDRAVEHPKKKYMLIVPEQFTMETQKKVVDMHPNGAVANIDVLSFNRLAFRIFSELGLETMTVLDDTGKSLILRKVIANEQKKLTIYREKVHMHGFVEEMKSVISELYLYDIGMEKYEKIKELSKENRLMTEKLNDIEIVYKAFQDYISEKFITKEELLDKLCEVLPDSRLLAESELYLDGFTGFTPVQNKLLELLLRYSKGITLSVTIGREELLSVREGIRKGSIPVIEQELFRMPKDTMNVFLKMWLDMEENRFSNPSEIGEASVFLEEASSIRFLGNQTLEQLESSLFRGKGRVKNNGSVMVYAKSTPFEEVEYAANYVAWQVKNKGMRYRDFAIISGDMEGYARILEDALILRDIPYFMDKRRSLILNPAVSFLRFALEMLEKNFSYETVFPFLKCGMAIMDMDDVDILENYCLACGIRSYKRFEEPFTRKKRKMTAEELEEVNAIRESFVSLVKEFHDAFAGAFLQAGEQLTVRKMTEYLYEFMCRFGIQKQLSEMEAEFLDAGEMSLGKEYGQTYEAIIDLFDRMTALLGEEVISLREYRQILEAGFEEIKVGVIPLGSDQMLVGDIERTRLNHVKVLIVLGANDGVLPKHSAKSGLLSQRDRNFLKKQQIELSPTVREGIFIQKFYLYLNLTKPERQLLVSYAESGSDGSVLRPSYLIGEIRRLYEWGNQKEQGNEDELNLASKAFAMRYLAEHLDADISSMSDFLRELYSYFYQDKEFADDLELVREGMFFDNVPTKLSKKVAEALVGNSGLKSVSRLEKYAACAYAHFLSYGLELSEREKYEVSMADIGTLYHRCIELFSNEMMRRNYDFAEISEADRNALMDECVDMVTKDYGNTILRSSRRNEYLIRKIKAVSRRTAWAVCEHIKRGEFSPESVEFGFSEGRVDRMDTYEQDGKLYVKIIDYKSGNKKFDMSDVFNGLQLQLVYYLGETLKVKRAITEGKEVLPAGTFYFNIKSPYIEVNERIPDEKLQAMLLKEYKMTGLVNDMKEPATAMDEKLKEEKTDSDIIPLKSKEIGQAASASGLNSENLEKMIVRVEKMTEQFAEEILDGHIEKNPYKKSISTPCDYCSYHSVCSFDVREFRNEYKKLVKISKPEDVLKELNRGEKDELDNTTTGSN